MWKLSSSHLLRNMISHFLPSYIYQVYGEGMFTGERGWFQKTSALPSSRYTILTMGLSHVSWEVTDLHDRTNDYSPILLPPQFSWIAPWCDTIVTSWCDERSPKNSPLKLTASLNSKAVLCRRSLERKSLTPGVGALLKSQRVLIFWTQVGRTDLIFLSVSWFEAQSTVWAPASRKKVYRTSSSQCLNRPQCWNPQLRQATKLLTVSFFLYHL